MSSKGTRRRKLMRWIQDELEETGKCVDKVAHVAWRLTHLAWRVGELLFIVFLSIGSPLSHAFEFAPKIAGVIRPNAPNGTRPEPKPKNTVSNPSESQLEMSDNAPTQVNCESTETNGHPIFGANSGESSSFKGKTGKKRPLTRTRNSMMLPTLAENRSTQPPTEKFPIGVPISYFRDEYGRVRPRPLHPGDTIQAPPRSPTRGTEGLQNNQKAFSQGR